MVFRSDNDLDLWLEEYRTPWSCTLVGGTTATTTPMATTTTTTTTTPMSQLGCGFVSKKLCPLTQMLHGAGIFTYKTG